MIVHRELKSSLNNVQVQLQHVIRIRNPARTTGVAQIPYVSSSSSDDRLNESTKVAHSRRSHRKSRYGCRNCKNRRLKCDETKPQCTRCMEIGIKCDYLFSQPQQARRQSRTPPYAVDAVAKMPPDAAGINMSLVAIERSIVHLIGSKDTVMQCTDGSNLTNLRILNHFKEGSTKAILNPKIKVVMQTGMIRSAFTSAHLMHTILGVACLHLNRMHPGDKNREILEIYHFQRAVQLYQAELACTNEKNINAENTASLIGSCLLLAINEFCPPGFTPEHSWVFTSNPADLNWLALQGGLRCILEITGSFINASIWGPAFQEAGDELKPFQGEQSGRGGLHHNLADLCDIDDHSTAETNPYYWPAVLLSRMLALKPYNRQENYSIFVTWMGQIEPEFITLLRAKDERALLLLSWWMALMCAVSSFQVWIYGRIVPECKAICQYLESTSTNPDMLRLMQWPAKACGYYDFTEGTFEDVTFDLSRRPI